MTTFAGSKVIAAKRALAVVAGGAALSPSGGVMIESFGGGDLSFLRHAGTDLMTIAALRLGIMFGMTESQPERRHVLWRA